MNRRDFLAAAGAAVLSRWSWAADVPRDVEITRVVCFDLEYKRPKYVGKNSHRDDHGEKAADRLLRIYTNAGVDGFGTCWSSANDCAQLLGRNPAELFQPDLRRMMCPLSRYTSPLWDPVPSPALQGKGRESLPAQAGRYAPRCCARPSLWVGA